MSQRAVEVEGGVIAVEERHGGDSVPVLFLHGVNSAGSVWSDVLTVLEPHRPVAAVDLRGHAGSTREGPFGRSRQVTDLTAVLDALGWSSAHLVGSTFCGGLALALAAEAGQRARSVTVLGTELEPAPALLDQVLPTVRRLGPEKFFTTTGPEWTFGPAPDPRWVAEADRIAADNTTDVHTELMRVAFTEDFRYTPDKLRCPVLGARGTHDRTCPAEAAAGTAAAFGTEVRQIAGAGHLPMVERPEDVVELVERFIGGVS
ncbi:alpha/beta fold hydrolase [Kibdelosporangium phytohabitans]|uniref:AB hydrolase-1 domain-containing protein n=1 Tax=Kibdelosporangium phytohabitans TaxID=860235 RepID=A0A0N9HWS7_9PSEU|nr:alpha/beta hydrolase [Kibdelosporangium phytohabitans]ALG09864.1 hypothetical protein AOZ06_25850 [Kibdelosporangium phytohabitans]MBE1468740.1 3-oxoadipate enol-lactonase/4-carboxymuconolactone decarboxylase [Kibdelosporangium phytohabitans]